MMIRPTGITISFGDANDGRARQPVVARIVGWPRDGSEAIHREMVVPAGEMVEQQLPLGQYSVELTLSSGRILQRNVRISEDTHQDFQFLEDFAPGENFSLQNAIGGSDENILADAAIASGNTSSAEYAVALQKANAEAARSPKRRGFKAGVGNRELLQPNPPAPPPTARLSLSLGILDWDRSNPFLEGKAKPIEPEQMSGDSALWRIQSSADFYEGPRPAYRHWARVEMPGDGIEMASLPLPWYCSGDRGSSAAEVLVDPARSGAHTIVAIRDERLSGLLAYLDRGQASVAAPLLKSLENDNLIEDVINAKMVNPLAACAAAYVGLAVYPPGTAEKWDAWLANCMQRFPDLPDAAIVHARRLLLRPTTPQDNALAADALRAAMGAGIPYFSVGVLLLREMLLLLSADHKDLKPLAEVAGRLASRVDPGQAFTVLRYAPISGDET